MKIMTKDSEQFSRMHLASLSLSIVGLLATAIAGLVILATESHSWEWLFWSGLSVMLTMLAVACVTQPRRTNFTKK